MFFPLAATLLAAWRCDDLDLILDVNALIANIARGRLDKCTWQSISPTSFAVPMQVIAERLFTVAALELFGSGTSSEDRALHTRPPKIDIIFRTPHRY